MNITTHGGTTDASDKQPGVVTIGSKDLLGCAWTQDRFDGSWATGCGELWELNAGTPKENGMKFCPCCGRALSETPYTESEQPNDKIQP